MTEGPVDNEGTSDGTVDGAFVTLGPTEGVSDGLIDIVGLTDGPAVGVLEEEGTEVGAFEGIRV